MDLALLWFAFLWGWLGGGKTTPERLPPDGGGLNPAPTPSPAPAPWPAVSPTGLPPFPGPGWEFDEPPPPAVVERARQLVSPLWARGQGAFQTERTGARWITYRAEVVRSGKRGVVAYRERPAVPVARAAAPRAPVARVPAAAAPRTSVPAPAGGAAPPAPAPPAAARPVMTAAAASPLSLPTLRRGMGIRPQAPNPDVRLLQTKLGIDSDGQFGAGTEAAVRAFQKRRGLDVDGVVGRDTWTALFAVRA